MEAALTACKDKEEAEGEKEGGRNGCSLGLVAMAAGGYGCHSRWLEVEWPLSRDEEDGRC